jgi:vitamin B12 transporter
MEKDDLFLNTEYAYVDSKDKKTDLRVAYKPKQTLTLTTGLENSIYGISASIIARSDIYADTANKVKAPGYATVDLNMYWNINPNIKVLAILKIWVMLNIELLITLAMVGMSTVVAKLL